MKQKGLAPIVIVVLIAAVVSLGGFLIYSQQTKPSPLLPQITQPIPTPTSSSTPDANPTPNGAGETANWKTYTASEFSFKYPADWYLTNCGNRENIYLNPKKQSCATEPPAFDINIIPNTSLKEPTFSAEQTKGILIAERKIILDGKEVPQADVDTSKGNQLGYEVKYTVTRVRVGSAIYDLILYSAFVLNKPSQKDVYKQLLSTFKFIP